jgi:superfamily I DNA/RNA helicase
LAEGIPARAIAVLTAAPESLAKLAKVVDDVAPKIVHNPGEDGVLIANLFKAKGLEFRAVAVTHLNGTHLPKAETLLIADESVRKARVSEERALLYVAMTRARDQLAVFYTGAPSHFLVETGLVE